MIDKETSSAKRVSLANLLNNKNYDEKRSLKAIEKKEKMIQEDILWMQFTAYTSLSKYDAKHKTWQSLNIDSMELEECAKKVRAWAPDCDYGMFLFGIPGNGKSHMMKALIKEHYSSSYTFRFCSVSDVMEQFKDFEKKEYLHDQLMLPNALVLDDLGTERASEYEQNQLFRLLEHRKAQGKHVFMTSNLMLNELKEKYSPRIVSRLGELMCFVENKASSFRKNINLQHQKDLAVRLVQS